MFASGLDMYRFVRVGQISRKQYQLVRLSPPLCGGAGMDVTENRHLLHMQGGTLTTPSNTYINACLPIYF